jgi:hypothetical protein
MSSSISPRSNPLDFSNNFSIYKEASSFKEKESFKEIKELVFLSYYKDFKLLLCSKCSLAIYSTAFKSHIIKHLKLFPKEEKASLLDQALLVYNSLEVSSLKESLELIILFTKSFELQAFKELKVLDLFLCNLNSNCSVILSSEYSIKRHIREKHSTSSSRSSLGPSYRVIKGQALEINKFFFEIKPKSLVLGSLEDSSRSRSNRSRSSSSSSRIDALEQAKEVFLASSSKKEEQYLEELSSFTLDPKDKLSPFQVKTRYIEYINKYSVKDLVELVAPLKENEKVLEVLVLNLEELLYLSLEKTVFLNKIHLNILNSFEDNKIRNKPFKPLLTNNTRVRYFRFFSLFLIFFFRALSKSLEKNSFYFRVDNSIVTIYKKLKDLVDLKLGEEQEDYLELSNQALKKSRRSINKKLNKLRLSSFVNQESLEDIEASSISSLDNLSISSRSNSSNTTSSSSKSLSSLLLDSSNQEILETIRDINKSKDTRGLEIKELLVELLIKLLKQKTDLYIFDSSFNSFFACISIRPKDNSFQDSLDLS